MRGSSQAQQGAWDGTGLQETMTSIRHENQDALGFHRETTVRPEDRMSYYERAIEFHEINIPFGNDTFGVRNRKDPNIIERLQAIVNIDVQKRMSQGKIKALYQAMKEESRIISAQEQTTADYILEKQISHYKQMLQDNNDRLRGISSELSGIAKSMSSSSLSSYHRSQLDQQSKELQSEVASISRRQQKLIANHQRQIEQLAREKGVALTKHFEQQKKILAAYDDEIIKLKESVQKRERVQNRLINEVEHLAHRETKSQRQENNARLSPDQIPEYYKTEEDYRQKLKKSTMEGMKERRFRRYDDGVGHRR